MKSLVHRLLHVHMNVVVGLFAFWILQFCGWMAMMVFIQFFDPRLGRSVLYVTQVSNWALVECAGTAAISSWTLLQAKHGQQVAREKTDVR